MPRNKKLRFSATKKPATHKSEDIPMMVCVICYNDFSYYSLNCLSWETAVTKDFYVAMNIPTEEQDGGSVVALPFCPECHSKVSVMFSIHQQLQSILQNFNCVRNDLAFTIVETIDKNCRKGPLDIVRQQIFQRWRDVHAKAKQSNNIDVFDTHPKDEYLKPSLTVMDVNDWAADSRTMSFMEESRKRSQERAGNSFSGARESKHLEERSIAKGPFPKMSISKKEVSGKNGKSKVTPEMPKLEPMAKLPIKQNVRLNIPLGKINGTLKKKTNTLLPNKIKLQKQSMSKVNLLKKAARGNNVFAKLQGNKNLSMVKKNAPKQLADGVWKCGYCPIAYSDLVRIKQHESACHPDTRPLVCHLCPKGFLSIYSLRRHVQKVHDQVIDGFTKCPYCVKSFSKKYSFEYHIRNAHKGKRIPKFVAQKESVQKNPTTTTTTVKVPMLSPPSPEITDLAPNPKSMKSISNSNAADANKKSEQQQSITGKRKSSTVTTTTPPIKRGRGRPSFASKEKENISQSVNVNSTEEDQEEETTKKNGYEDKEEKEKIVKEESNSNGNSVQPESFPCLKCDAKFATESVLKKHMATHTDEKETDEKEESVSNESSKTEVEVADANGNDSPTTTESEDSSKLNVRKTRGRPANPKSLLACTICGKEFEKIQSLCGHMTVHKKVNGETRKVGSLTTKGKSEDNVPAE